MILELRGRANKHDKVVVSLYTLTCKLCILKHNYSVSFHGKEGTLNFSHVSNKLIFKYDHQICFIKPGILL